jgi:hypothetical protein
MPSVGTSTRVELDAFVIANECTKREPSGAAYSMELAGLKPKRGATYVSIICCEKERVY